ncbi:sulfite exporter TauE/SafE family protein [Desulfofustis glycolicus]|uniref:Probable membrane transporter protein n=1 Tax=Desulfofustis glycolicus DSM 9705 TaxID=1121409 RepID=A0A1M5X4R0_9BACT|nr:sulfite exporter TauE/SafE family protein [Desulfofustis glycolicus]MCB2216098.1 sulfite exporter TauE/SafE family protein [Desulfobulbaceae bacterium]SHH94796.1 hypothetical protein SAMN02745124_02749 [Desulfofustis glycolicus DSM 9705]
MDLTDYSVILTAYIMASAIKGLTGLGFSTSCLPVLALHFDLKIAIPLVLVPSIVSNITVIVQAGRFREAVSRFWPLYLAAVPGLLFGLAVLATINSDVAKAVLGLVLMIYALWAMTNMTVSLPTKWERALRVPIGFMTGIVNGMTGSQVMPVLPYLLSLNLEKNDFVQAINISFTFSSLVMLLGLNQLGYLTATTFLIALAGLVPVLLTLTVAGRLRRRLTTIVYRRLVLGLLLVMGMILLLRNFL